MEHNNHSETERGAAIRLADAENELTAPAREEFRRALEQAAFLPPLTPEIRETLTRHFALLTAANRRFNLTAITDPAAAAVKHYADSLALLPRLDELAGAAADPALADLGSGGGFPGLALAVARPELPVVLLEAAQKKCQFLADCAAALALPAVQALPLRAEDAGRDPAFRGRFAFVTARAVAELRVLLEYALPLLRPGGRFFAYKGAAWAEEVAAAQNAARLLGGEFAEPLRYTLPGGEQRAVVEIVKTGATPDKYPRRPGMPEKRPL